GLRGFHIHFSLSAGVHGYLCVSWLKPSLAQRIHHLPKTFIRRSYHQEGTIFFAFNIFCPCLKSHFNELVFIGAGRKNNFAALGKQISNRTIRSEEHTSELQSRFDLVCRLLLEKKKK